MRILSASYAQASCYLAWPEESISLFTPAMQEARAGAFCWPRRSALERTVGVKNVLVGILALAFLAGAALLIHLLAAWHPFIIVIGGR